MDLTGELCGCSCASYSIVNSKHYSDLIVRFVWCNT